MTEYPCTCGHAPGVHAGRNGRWWCCWEGDKGKKCECDVFTETCGATFSLGDDFGDNSCTFHCDLAFPHPGRHHEVDGGTRGTAVPRYSIFWEPDQRLADLYLKVSIECMYIRDYRDWTTETEKGWDYDLDSLFEEAKHRLKLEGIRNEIRALRKRIEHGNVLLDRLRRVW